MWTLKLEVDANNSTIGKLAIKHKIILHLFRICFSREDDNYYISSYAGVINGEPSATEEFKKDLENIDQIINKEFNDSFFVCSFREHKRYAAAFDPDIIFLEPWIINGCTGKHTLVISSWQKSKITEYSDAIKEHHESRITKITDTAVSNIFTFAVRPHLTEQQKKALAIAIKEGYYDYPRNIGLKELARISKISYSTFQAHLRKAEKKILPYSINTE
ncbi:MAG: helix-turn-helix domain-containing protein [Candidatus Woesearchaeota archaeon]